MAEESIKVAVRVRPFNQREKEKNSKLVISMKDQSTFIKNLDTNEEPKQFTFDYSYWSHDGYKEEPNGYLVPESPKSQYASQKKVFDDLGKGILNNAFEGFNCSLFAYGQTGSGKSYSIVGYGVNKGIIPLTCELLFQKLNETDNSKPDQKYEISFSMIEIYNEIVRDLLCKDNPKGGLQVRQHPSQGFFYAQGVKRVPVGSYSAIEARIDEGTANRTVASTNMNATSSRAHTIATITFDQLFTSAAGETRKSSIINLVDLAGSERADSTGATGDRLKEGANINKSLSALGNCISALAELSNNSKKKIVVPYRDSVLTKLLQNALGGNSKTIMIAALSPADTNYDETLSTLRYADRAKQIKNKAVVNENPIEKMIRELKEENERLKQLLQTRQYSSLTSNITENLTEKEKEAMQKTMEEEVKAQLIANQELLQEAKISWEEKLEIAQKEAANETKDTAIKEKRKHNEPYLTNLNEDPMLSNVICQFIGVNVTVVGRSKKCDIQLHGLSIMEEHAILKRVNSKVELKAAQNGAKIKINGVELMGSRILENEDRIVFGSSSIFVFIDPKETKPSTIKEKIDWEFAQNEIAAAKGFATRANNKLSKDQQKAQEEIIKLLPLVSEANAISEELNKYINFEVVVIPTIAVSDDTEESALGQKVVVKVSNLLDQNAWLWDSGKFMNRRFLMLDHYQKYLDGDEDILYIKREDDPFWEPLENLFLGISNVFLQSLAYLMDFNDKIAINDYKGHDIGTIGVSLMPCTQQGKPLSDDSFNEDPNTLISKPYHFKILIRFCDIIYSRYSKFLLKYKVYNEKTYTETSVIQKNAKIGNLHSRVITFPSITKDHLIFFESGSVTFIVYGIQETTHPDEKLFRMTTKELKNLRENEYNASKKDNGGVCINGEMDTAHLKTEFILIQKKYNRLEQKEKQLQKLCNEYSTQTLHSKGYEQFYKAVCSIMAANNSKLKNTAEAVTHSNHQIEDYNHDNHEKQHNNTDNTPHNLNGNNNNNNKTTATNAAAADNTKDNNKQNNINAQSKTCTIN